MSTDNNIGDEGANVLSQYLTQLTQLTHLNFSSKCCAFNVILGVCDVCDVCDVCNVCVSIVNKIGYEGTKALSQCLPHLTQLTYLNLSSECVHIDVIIEVCRCVVSH